MPERLPAFRPFDYSSGLPLEHLQVPTLQHA